LCDCLNAYYGDHIEVMGKLHNEFLERKNDEFIKNFIKNGGLEKLGEVVKRLCEKTEEDKGGAT